VPELDWEQLAKASMHPLALRILEKAAAGEKLSPKAVADELGEKLGNVSYHVRTLHEKGLLEKAGTKPRRGAVQHFYVIAEKALG
jgi:DNA-binding MarR family transcriptional regulator